MRPRCVLLLARRAGRKGVVYSHRSIVLHSLAEATKDTFDIGHEETVFADCADVSREWMGNSFFQWFLMGAKIVLPGPYVDAESLLQLMIAEEVSIACGVPTVWIGACWKK